MFGNTSYFWKFVNFLPVVPVYGIIFTVVYSYTRFCLKDLIKDTSRVDKLFVVALFYFCAIMTFVTHTISMLTDPGAIPIDYHHKMKELNSDLEYDADGIPLIGFKDEKEIKKIINKESGEGDNDKSDIKKTRGNKKNKKDKNDNTARNNNGKSGTSINNTGEAVNEEECECEIDIETTINNDDKKVTDKLNEKDTKTSTVEKEITETRKRNPFYCIKCSIWRPQRAHHCKTCLRCVLTFDHHCPWIANCVGYHNHKNFLQFLFYASLGDGVAFCCLLVKTFEVDLNVVNYLKNAYPRGIPSGGLGVWDVMMLIKDPLILISGCILSLAMTLAFICFP